MYATCRHTRGEGIPASTRCFARAIAICLLAAWMLFAHREAAAQQFVFRHYQEREGISNLSVTCLLQDKEGFIWACTENGLYRYDGVAFERVGDAQGLGNSTIGAAAQDGAGTLWIGTAQDLYRGDGFHFKPIRPEDRRLKLGSGLLNCSS
jgi:ligand-binding sensor domain-containing protein